MVFVDNYYDTGILYRGMKMCHMISDTTDELLAMVDKIGVQRKWIQHPGTLNEHFDVCFSKRALAVKFGAKEIHFKEYAKIIEQRCKKQGVHFALASKTQRRKPSREVDINYDFHEGRGEDNELL